MTIRRKHFLIGILPLVCLIAAAIPAYVITAAPRSAEEENEAIVHRNGTACGVERWFVKTGMDRDARLVNLRSVTPTNISKMRSLTPPATLPSTSRIRPVETTVWSESAILLRYKMETDSDYHLVLADTGGRTMIAEIPSPNCVGSSSPFLSAIKSARRAFDAKYTASDTWQRVHIPVQVVGVGFFDFKHGQSGVAPNAIELHPVLSIRFGSAGAKVPLPPAPPPSSNPKPPASSSGSFSVHVSVSPNPVSYGSYATLTATSNRGAVCTAQVVYSTGRPPRSFDGSAKTVGSNGKVSWSWHMESKGTSGTATVTCTRHGQSKTASASFGIG